MEARARASRPTRAAHPLGPPPPAGPGPKAEPRKRTGPSPSHEVAAPSALTSRPLTAGPGSRHIMPKFVHGRVRMLAPWLPSEALALRAATPTLARGWGVWDATHRGRTRSGPCVRGHAGLGGPGPMPRIGPGRAQRPSPPRPGPEKRRASSGSGTSPPLIAPPEGSLNHGPRLVSVRLSGTRTTQPVQAAAHQHPPGGDSKSRIAGAGIANRRPRIVLAALSPRAGRRPESAGPVACEQRLAPQQTLAPGGCTSTSLHPLNGEAAADKTRRSGDVLCGTGGEALLIVARALTPIAAPRSAGACDHRIPADFDPSVEDHAEAGDGIGLACARARSRGGAGRGGDGSVRGTRPSPAGALGSRGWAPKRVVPRR